MKKTYLTPETILTEIELQKMIATSDPQIKPEEEADPEGEVLSRRRRDVWEEDEEEEEEW